MLGEYDAKLLADRFQQEGVVIEIGPFALRLRLFTDALIAQTIDRFGYHSVIEEEVVVDFDVIAKPVSRLRSFLKTRIAFYRNGEKWFHHFPQDVAWPMLCWAINNELLLRPNQYLILHAATLAKGEHAVLIPGASGAGKSTLCAALMLRGWRLLSDELGLIPIGEKKVLPVPMPVSLKNESIEVIRQFDRSAHIGQVAHGTTKGTVAHVRPTHESLQQRYQHAQVKWVIEPCYQPEASLALTQRSKVDGMIHAAYEAINYSVIGQGGFDSLTGVFDGATAYQLHYSNLDDAIACLDDLAAQEAKQTEVAS